MRDEKKRKKRKKNAGDKTKKTLSKTGPRSLRISDLPANEKTFQLSMFFLRRVFSRCNKLNVTHIPGARFSITLCFPPVSTVRRLLSTPRLYARAGIPGRLHFYPPALRCPSLEKKIFFFFINTSKIVPRHASAVTGVRPEILFLYA